MNLHRRNASLLLLAAFSFTIMSTWFATTPYWPGALISGFLAIMSSCRLCSQVKQAWRQKQEVEWWRRAKLGAYQPPLDPCCMRFEAFGRHDRVRCTDVRPAELRAYWDEIDNDFDELTAELRDANQEEEM